MCTNFCGSNQPNSNKIESPHETIDKIFILLAQFLQTQTLRSLYPRYNIELRGWAKEMPHSRSADIDLCLIEVPKFFFQSQ